jgi:cation diffusion facilitator family transporter
VLTEPRSERASLARWAWLSVAAAVLTLALKLAAWWWTGSIGLFSDAMESFVNLAAALFAVLALRVADQPADHNHQYGHDKIEYFSGGFEGSLILLAAGAIAWAAIDRLLHPVPLHGFDLGLLLAVIASLINGVVGWKLLQIGRQHHSLTLESDGHHLLTDVWTSVGVIGGLVVIGLGGWWWLDPVIALVVAANIVWTGASLLRRAWQGLMDEALDDETAAQIEAVLDQCCGESLQWHALRHRRAGRRMFATVHVLVPGDWRVQRAHDLAERIEQQMHAALPSLHIVIHLEPLEDERAYRDLELR